MIRSLLVFTATLSLTLGMTLGAAQAVEVGKPAPGLKGQGADGKTYDLAELKGKYVVLEWLNHGCPYVQKHYNSKNMQATQAKYTEKGVVWLSIISSAEGKQGYAAPAQALADAKEKGSKATAIVLDPKGELGKAYEADTTPDMVVVDPAGNVIYLGAIDSKPTADPADIATATNYVSAALDAAMAGKPVATATTQSYGCSVKY